MKTITSILAAAALFASVGAAQANFAEDFWNKQQLFGENVQSVFEEQQFFGEAIDADQIRSGQVLHPEGFFGAGN